MVLNLRQIHLEVNGTENHIYMANLQKIPFVTSTGIPTTAR